MPGLHWDAQAGGIREITLETYMMTPLHKRKSAFLVGAAGAGKATLQKSLGQVFCARTDLQRFFCGKALDP
eukprot:3589334-Alexandrium_andersonii.AAC.1